MRPILAVLAPRATPVVVTLSVVQETAVSGRSEQQSVASFAVTRGVASIGMASPPRAS